MGRERRKGKRGGGKERWKGRNYWEGIFQL